MSWADIVRGYVSEQHPATNESSIRFIDIGVNLASKQFRGNLDTILKEAKQAGISMIISISNSLQEAEENALICEAYNMDMVSYPEIKMTIGVHPHSAKTWTTQSAQKITELVGKYRQYVVAIGECGLDYNRMFSTKDQQQRCFLEQINLARTLSLPLYLHERDAHDDMIRILSSSALRIPRVIHCFTGSEKMLNRYLNLGCMIGITGWICDEKRGQELRTALQSLPMDSLMIETDAPWLRPTNAPKSKINVPANVRFIAEKVAELLHKDIEEVARTALRNTEKFFF